MNFKASPYWATAGRLFLIIFPIFLLVKFVYFGDELTLWEFSKAILVACLMTFAMSLRHLVRRG